MSDRFGDDWFGNDSELLQHCWHPVLPAADLSDKPLAVTVAGSAFVLVRLGDDVVAYQDLCPHRRVPLSSGTVEGRELVCGYHGWRFDRTGRCTTIPALGPGAAVPRGMGVPVAGGVCVADGMIWLAPRTPLTGPPRLPASAIDLVWGRCPPRVTPASIGALMDNFLDVAHFSYLHRDSIGVTEPVVVDEFDVSTDALILTASHEATVHHGPDGKASPAAQGEPRVASYRMHGPTVLDLGLAYPESGHVAYVVIWMHASGPAETTVHKLIGWPADDAARLPEKVDGEVAILEEDLGMVELIRDARLPLALREEQHTKADRAGVEFRKMLAAGLAGLA